MPPTPAELRTSRLAYLWSSATAHLEAPDLSRLLLLSLDARVATEHTAVPTKARQRWCGTCFIPLAPGINCRVTQKKHPRRLSARRRSLRILCESCGTSALFPMPPPPSCRASSESSSYESCSRCSNPFESLPSAPCSAHSSYAIPTRSRQRDEQASVTGTRGSLFRRNACADRRDDDG